MSVSGTKMSPEVEACCNKMKGKGPIRSFCMEVDDAGKTIGVVPGSIVNKVDETTKHSVFDDYKFESGKPMFVMVNMDCCTGEGSDTDDENDSHFPEPVLMKWVSDDCSIKRKMLAGSNWEFIKKECGKHAGNVAVVELSDNSEANVEHVLENCSKNMRKKHANLKKFEGVNVRKSKSKK